VGGSAASIGGGKFVNGAALGAFAALLNEFASSLDTVDESRSLEKLAYSSIPSGEQYRLLAPADFLQMPTFNRQQLVTMFPNGFAPHEPGVIPGIGPVEMVLAIGAGIGAGMEALGAGVVTNWARLGLSTVRATNITYFSLRLGSEGRWLDQIRSPMLQRWAERIRTHVDFFRVPEVIAEWFKGAPPPPPP
jgi:hypothetical protein